MVNAPVPNLLFFLNQITHFYVIPLTEQNLQLEIPTRIVVYQHNVFGDSNVPAIFLDSLNIFSGSMDNFGITQDPLNHLPPITNRGPALPFIQHLIGGIRTLVW